MAKRVPFTDADLARMRADYRAYVERGELDLLCTEMGRSKCVLCEKARELGLTDAQAARESAASIAKTKCTGVPKWNDKPHPKGFLGGSHDAETRKTLGAKSRAFRQSLSKDEVADIALRMMKTRFARHGRLAPNVKRGSWKAGWREIGGGRKYYRSRWEANYARYLQWLQNRGDILDWKHEPETFWFERIKRGCRSYLPDFRVWEADGTSKLHEVKGWEDARSKTVLKRMRIYHPQETIIVIREKQYREIERKLGGIIEGWE